MSNTKLCGSSLLGSRSRSEMQHFWRTPARYSQRVSMWRGDDANQFTQHVEVALLPHAHVCRCKRTIGGIEADLKLAIFVVIRHRANALQLPRRVVVTAFTAVGNKHNLANQRRVHAAAQ